MLVSRFLNTCYLRSLKDFWLRTCLGNILWDCKVADQRNCTVDLHLFSVWCRSWLKARSVPLRCWGFLPSFYTEIEYKCMMPHRFSVSVVECIWPRWPKMDFNLESLFNWWWWIFVCLFTLSGINRLWSFYCLFLAFLFCIRGGPDDFKGLVDDWTSTSNCLQTCVCFKKHLPKFC